MEIRTVPVSEINPTLYNPRIDLKPEDPEYIKLEASIEEFGYVDPIIWNETTGNLVGGHQRFKILISQGMKEIEVSVVRLSLEKEKALNLALNKIQGGWDEDKLSKLIEDLSAIPDFDISLTGFDAPEISQLLDKAEEAREDNFDFEEELKKIGEPITQKGDIIFLGKHRLSCGDSSVSEDIAEVIGNEKVNLLFTDPPYNVNYYGGNRPNSKVRPKPSREWARIYNDNLSQDEYEAWLGKILSNITPHLAAGAPFYIWNGHRQFGPMHLLLEKLGFHISTVITWAKESFAIGYGDYNQQTEFALYGYLENNGAHCWYGPNNESTLWEIRRDPTATYAHPTQKSIALAYRAIKNSSKRGDIVLDAFLGSGTTLIAAEQLDRICYGVEIDPCYCDVIVRRYIAYKGKENVSPELVKKYLPEVTNG